MRLDLSPSRAIIIAPGTPTLESLRMERLSEQVQHPANGTASLQLGAREERSREAVVTEKERREQAKDAHR